MQDHAAVVGHDPLAERIAIGAKGLEPVILLQFCLYFTGNRLELGLRGASADDVEIREGRVPAKVEGDDIFRFFIGGNAGAQTCKCF